MSPYNRKHNPRGAKQGGQFRARSFTHRRVTKYGAGETANSSSDITSNFSIVIVQ